METSVRADQAGAVVGPIGASSLLAVYGDRPATAKTPRASLGSEELAQVDLSSMPKHFPVSNMDFDLTEDCNLACLYCFKGEMYSKHMTLNTMKRALDWLLVASGEVTSVNINFMGGEPTMRWKQIREFVPWALRRGKSMNKVTTFSMTSNLTLWTQDIRSFVDDHGFGVLMSIDGAPEVQDAQRPAKNGRAMSHIVEYWARSMLRTRPNSTARMTIHPKFAARFSESVTYLASIGFKEIAVSLSEYHLWTPDLIETMRQETERVITFIEGEVRNGREFRWAALNYYLSKLIHPRAEGKHANIEFTRSPCGAGKGYLMVDYTGDIWPCHRFDGADTAAQANGQFRMGNIFKPGFNNRLQRVFLDFDHSQVHKSSCDECPVNEICGGYCPAANLSDTGSIYTPHDTFCAWSQLQYKLAEDLYRRCENDKGSLDNLLKMAVTATNDGQK